ncbi:hypothetical protein [Devosia sediminis]|uniref:Uncharacterized protein n=1 Tax=Devosia sediminis TaxID=2798801 RepID=A0A934INX4_9HYPH|nr:hypothetical protein [Devosia sediminis]MBJ3784194.1 hypothetical protein [Devosia sediminis]
MTYRAKGWLFAIASSLALWILLALAAHEAVMLWDEPGQILFEGEQA